MERKQSYRKTYAMVPLKVMKHVRLRPEEERSVPGVDTRSREQICFDQMLQSLKAAHKEGRTVDVRAIAVELFQLDTREANQQQLLVPVWKPLYKSITSALDNLCAHPSDDTYALVVIRCKDSLRILDQLYQQLGKLGNRRSGRRTLQRLFMYMGDVHRYEAKAATAFNKPDAKHIQCSLTHYTAAWVMAPGVGHASNQLALVHQSRHETLLSLYFYLRAIFSAEDAFTKAVDNFEGALASHCSRGTSTLDNFEDAAVELIRVFWACARRSDTTYTPKDVDARVSLVISTLKSYISDGAMLDAASSLPLRLLLCLIMCCNGSQPPLALLAAIQRLQDFVYEQRNAIIHSKSTGSSAFDAVNALSAACEVSGRWFAAHARHRTSSWESLRRLNKRDVDIERHPPLALSSSMLPEDKELEGMLLLWDDTRREYLPLVAVSEYYGRMHDRVLPQEATAQLRSHRVAYLAKIAAIGNCSIYADDDEDDIIVFTEHANDDLF